MRISFALMLLALFHASASDSFAQSKISMNAEKITLEQFFSEIRKQTGEIFVYNTSDINVKQTISVSCENEDIAKVLNNVLGDLDIGYTLHKSHISVHKKQQALQQEQRTVHGQITDEDGAPIFGVTVVLKGTTSGVATDANGNYSIEYTPQHSTLEISYIGYKKTELQINNRTLINIQLEPETVAITDVVVTGYQTISRERATGAFEIIGSDVLDQKPTGNISNVLEGLVPGLAIQSSPVDGQTRFLIRGQGTLQNDQVDRDPLIVVDGFPINGFSFETGKNNEDKDPLRDIIDPFATVNPNDVESITILKDAAATSIYGARAANGVIVITTKKAKGKSRLDISADAFVSVSSRADLDYLYNMASAETQFRFVELMHNYTPVNLTGTNDPYISPTARVGYKSEPYSLLFERDGKGHITDAEYESEKARLIDIGNRGLWKKDLNKYVYRNAINRQFNIGIRGATDIMNYGFSASYDKEDQHLKGNSNERFLANMTGSANLTKNLTFDVSMNTVFSKKEDNGVTISNLTPWSRIVDDNGNFTHWATNSTVYYPILMSEYEGKTPASWLYNPVEDQKYMDNYSKNMNLRIQGGFTYQTLFGLKLSAKGQYERSNFTSRRSYDPESFKVRDFYNTYSTLNASTGNYTSYFPAGGIFTDAGNTFEGYTLRAQADYNRDFDRHSITFLAGTELISSSYDIDPAITRYGYNKYTYSVISTPDYVTRTDNIFGVSSLMPYDALGSLLSNEDRFFSVYAIAGYTYDGRLSLTASFRTDASNFQATEVRDKFSPFWSIGGSWLISRERFMENAEWINQLKIRSSYGIAGVAAGKRGVSSVTTLAVHPGNIIYTDNDAYNSISTRGNPTLTWEKSRTLNIGLDLSLWDYKFSGSLDYYNKYSYDVLSNATVPVITQGVSAATFNNAEILNRGVELSLGSNLRVAGDLRWKGNFTLAYNKNEVKKYLVNAPFSVADANYSTSINSNYIVNYPIDRIFVFDAAGYTPEGYIVLKGKDGTEQAVIDRATSHELDQIQRQDGETMDDYNWAFYLGTRTPKTNIGFSNQFSWKGFTLSVMITGRFGYYVPRENSFNFINLSSPSYSKQLEKSFAVYDQGYSKQTSYSALPLYNDDNFDVFQGSNAYMYSVNLASRLRSNYIKGDHIRLNEIYLGYDFPKHLLAKQNVFSRVNIYAQVRNLGIIWSANKEIDPDYPIGSIKPLPTFLFGVKFNFK